MNDVTQSLRPSSTNALSASSVRGSPALPSTTSTRRASSEAHAAVMREDSTEVCRRGGGARAQGRANTVGHTEGISVLGVASNERDANTGALYIHCLYVACAVLCILMSPHQIHAITHAFRLPLMPTCACCACAACHAAMPCTPWRRTHSPSPHAARRKVTALPACSALAARPDGMWGGSSASSTL